MWQKLASKYLGSRLRLLGCEFCHWPLLILMLLTKYQYPARRVAELQVADTFGGTTGGWRNRTLVERQKVLICLVVVDAFEIMQSGILIFH